MASKKNVVMFYSQDDHPIRVFMLFEEDFKKKVEALGYTVLDVTTSRCIKNPTLSFEIFRKSDGVFFKNKDMRIKNAMNPSSGFGRDPMLFLRLDIDFANE